MKFAWVGLPNFCEDLFPINTFTFSSNAICSALNVSDETDTEDLDATMTHISTQKMETYFQKITQRLLNFFLANNQENKFQSPKTVFEEQQMADKISRAVIKTKIGCHLETDPWDILNDLFNDLFVHLGSVME